MSHIRDIFLKGLNHSAVAERTYRSKAALHLKELHTHYSVGTVAGIWDLNYIESLKKRGA